MSEITNTLAIAVPDHFCPTNTVERFHGMAIPCPYCKGKGIFTSEKAKDVYDNSPCPVCLGQKKIKPVCRIEWVPEFDK